MQFHATFDDNQSQTRAGTIPHIAAAKECPEQPLAIPFRDANSAVAHLDEGVRPPALDGEFHRGAVGRILDRIREEVGEDVPEQPFIRLGGGHRRRQRNLDRTSVAGRGQNFVGESSAEDG